jgi:hypothetical protein
MNLNRDDKLRHYRLMLELLEAYEQKQFGLRHLIDHLQELLSALEDAPNDWRHNFYRSWGVLEDAYANAQKDGNTHLKPEDNPMVNPAVAKLKELVQSQLR